MLIAKVYTTGWEVHAHTFPDNDRKTAIAWARKFLAEENSTEAIIFQESYFASGSPKEMRRIWQQKRIPMPQKIFVIQGSTGQYSDWTCWHVAAYTTREQANLHCERLSAAMVPAPPHTLGSYQEHKERKAQQDAIRATLDPHCDIDYNGAEYEVVELVLYCHLDEFLERSV